jgi:hypothetical protein
MSYKDKIITLAKSYEGEDKLGILTELDFDFNNSIDIKHDRYPRDGEDPKAPVTVEREVWSVTLRYKPDSRSYDSTRIKSDGAESLEKCFLLLQEYLKIELSKIDVRKRISNGTLREEKMSDKPRDIFKELATALSIEDYEKASELRDEIINNNKIIK